MPRPQVAVYTCLQMLLCLCYHFYGVRLSKNNYNSQSKKRESVFLQNVHITVTSSGSIQIMWSKDVVLFVGILMRPMTTSKVYWVLIGHFMRLIWIQPIRQSEIPAVVAVRSTTVAWVCSELHLHCLTEYQKGKISTNIWESWNATGQKKVSIALQWSSVFGLQ